jgi:hypothetical protein
MLATRAKRLVDQKRKPPKKVLLLRSTFANTKFYLASRSCKGDSLRLVQKRFLGSAKKDGILLI